MIDKDKAKRNTNIIVKDGMFCLELLGFNSPELSLYNIKLHTLEIDLMLKFEELYSRVESNLVKLT